MVSNGFIVSKHIHRLNFYLNYFPFKLCTYCISFYIHRTFVTSFNISNFTITSFGFKEKLNRFCNLIITLVFKTYGLKENILKSGLEILLSFVTCLKKTYLRVQPFYNMGSFDNMVQYICIFRFYKDNLHSAFATISDFPISVQPDVVDLSYVKIINSFRLTNLGLKY